MYTFSQEHILDENNEQITYLTALPLRPRGGGVDIPKRIITETSNNAEKIDVQKLGVCFWEMMGVRWLLSNHI